MPRIKMRSPGGHVRFHARKYFLGETFWLFRTGAHRGRAPARWFIHRHLNHNRAAPPPPEVVFHNHHVSVM